MSGLALALLFVAAWVHATWNFLSKRSRGGPAFVWLTGTASAVLYAPVAVGLFLWQRPALGGRELFFMVGSGILHTAYFLTLQKGYRTGDLSLVYPLARGTGPFIATLTAILFFGERPGPVALLGAALVPLGVFVLTGGGAASRGEGTREAVKYGLLTGVLIAAYTLWDKHTVSTLAVFPLFVEYASNVVRSLALSPYVLSRWDDVKEEWARHRGTAVAVGALASVSYVLVLTAMSFTPVSYVAPAREMSILIGTFMGARVLDEGHALRRIAGAAGIVAGVVALALG